MDCYCDKKTKQGKCPSCTACAEFSKGTTFIPEKEFKDRASTFYRKLRK